MDVLAQKPDAGGVLNFGVMATVGSLVGVTPPPVAVGSAVVVLGTVGVAVGSSANTTT